MKWDMFLPTADVNPLDTNVITLKKCRMSCVPCVPALCQNILVLKYSKLVLL